MSSCRLEEGCHGGSRLASIQCKNGRLADVATLAGRAVSSKPPIDGTLGEHPLP